MMRSPEEGPLNTKKALAEGSLLPRTDALSYPIPGRLNVFLVVIQVSAAFAVLAAASHAATLLGSASLGVVFAFVMQLGFCLAHEAVHGKLHDHHSANLGFGILVFSLFPGSFHFFQVAHLIHHRRNRSDAELEDYVLPTEVAWLKQMAYYLLICGLFWLLIPVSSIVIALVPRNTIQIPAPDEEAGAFRRFAQFLNEVRPGWVRRDLLVAGCLWGAAILLLKLKLVPVIICYAVFAFSWASQQYVYHVRTPRHAVLGALDLRLWRPIEMLYLHFNYHLTHHLAVWVPWIYLPEVAAEQPSSGYFVTYLNLWRPPQPIEQAWPEQFQTLGPLPSQQHPVPDRAGVDDQP
jgi:fatty acid desaturase